MDNRVLVNGCTEYSSAGDVVRAHLESLGQAFSGKKVLIKPNLVTPALPEKCITTHPSLVEAAAGYISENGGSVTIADSPGGPYAEALLRYNYKVTGMAAAARKTGAKLNFDTKYRTFTAPVAVTCHYFDVITPVLDADIIVNIAKLKSHTLTVMSAAAKNLFGIVPGVGKFGVHARYRNQDDFQSALVDLVSAICRTKTVISIVDAVEAMEGNGPTGGSPRHVGCVVSGLNPFAADLACADIIGVTGDVRMLEYAAERGFCPDSLQALELTGDDIGMFRINDFLKPDTHRSRKFGLLHRFMAPRPVIGRQKCAGCGKCVENCPAKTIVIKQYGTRKKAEIIIKGCIRCYCCQELCPFNAVDIKKSFIFRF